MKRLGAYFSLLLLVIIILLTASTLSIKLQKQKSILPNQPISDPEGASYQYSEIKVTSYGEGQNQYWIFEPDTNKSVSVPVIVHGWGAIILILPQIISPLILSEL